ncbi:NADH-quinone oxidoreductase subunit 4 [compost metagenome]
MKAADEIKLTAPAEPELTGTVPGPEDFYQDLHTELMFLNFGPSHPATHGTLRALMALDGETIKAAVGEIGYLHRGFEKSVEHKTYNKVIPYTDRLNYCSAILNNIGYVKAVERMLDIEVPDRTKFIRVIVGELSRMIDHLVCIGPQFVDMGALTNLWYVFNQREKVYDVLDKLTGARLTNSYTRVGGLYRDFYDGCEKDILHVVKAIEDAVDEVEKLVGKNRIVMDRTEGVCVVSAEDAISYGFTGPTLRASGVDFDIRKAQPYYYYDTFDFEVPVGTKGDTWDRIFVRFYEVRESAKIIRQAIKNLPGGPIWTDDKRVKLPEKQDTYQNIEGLINHFKLIFEGTRVPAGEIYDATEAANGELGFYITSDGSGYPYRVRVRPPCFLNYAAFPEMIEGYMISDAAITLASLNIIAGELDR